MRQSRIRKEPDFEEFGGRSVDRLTVERKGFSDRRGNSEGQVHYAEIDLSFKSRQQDYAEMEDIPPNRLSPDSDIDSKLVVDETLDLSKNLMPDYRERSPVPTSDDDTNPTDVKSHLHSLLTSGVIQVEPFFKYGQSLEPEPPPPPVRRPPDFRHRSPTIIITPEDGAGDEQIIETSGTTLTPTTLSGGATLNPLQTSLTDYQQDSDSPLSVSITTTTLSTTPLIPVCTSTTSRPPSLDSPKTFIQLNPAQILHRSTSSPQERIEFSAPDRNAMSFDERKYHCPILRVGPALGCFYCWNTTDATGRSLRRKTKYECRECSVNLCIVPCFQEFHKEMSKKQISGGGPSTVVISTTSSQVERRNYLSVPKILVKTSSI